MAVTLEEKHLKLQIELEKLAEKENGIIEKKKEIQSKIIKVEKEMQAEKTKRIMDIIYKNFGEVDESNLDQFEAVLKKNNAEQTQPETFMNFSR